MEMHLDGPASPGEPCRATFAGAFTIYEAAEAKPALLDALARAGRFDIDLALVSEMDTAAVQLLVLLKREASLLDRPLTIVHGPASARVVERYKLGAFLG
jgi:anti-sigma B factor antagonist